MSGCGDKLEDPHKDDTPERAPDQPSKDEASTPVASFSMAHALSMLRRRQKDQNDAQKKGKDKPSEEELKEKAREKRRRRRKNQKKAREEYKARLAAAGEVNEIPGSSKLRSHYMEVGITVANTIINTSNESNHAGIKINTFVPRAIMLKKKKET